MTLSIIAIIISVITLILNVTNTIIDKRPRLKVTQYIDEFPSLDSNIYDKIQRMTVSIVNKSPFDITITKIYLEDARIFFLPRFKKKIFHAYWGWLEPPVTIEHRRRLDKFADNKIKSSENNPKCRYRFVVVDSAGKRYKSNYKTMEARLGFNEFKWSDNCKS